MEGLLLYNGKGNPDDWVHIFCRTDIRFYDVESTFLHETRTEMAKDTKRHFVVGGPKCLIEW